MFGKPLKALPKECKETQPPPCSPRPITPTQTLTTPALSVPQGGDKNSTPRASMRVPLANVPSPTSTKPADQERRSGVETVPSARLSPYVGHWKPAQINQPSSFSFRHRQLTRDISLFSGCFPRASCPWTAESADTRCPTWIKYIFKTVTVKPIK